MWTYSIILLVLLSVGNFIHSSTNISEGPVLYYYGLEESERGLEECVEGQACAALVARYWRSAALVRLCRCARRRRCDTPAPPQRRVQYNNRAHLQFCEPVTPWPECAITDPSVTVETLYDRLNPDDLEKLHHKNIQLVPPKIVFSCRCHEPNRFKLITSNGTSHVYQCSELPPCVSGEFCGNVGYDLNSLYQSCLCPKHHICVHNGGVTHHQISELLYRGKGWKAYCQNYGDDYSYEDYT